MQVVYTNAASSRADVSRIPQISADVQQDATMQRALSGDQEDKGSSEDEETGPTAMLDTEERALTGQRIRYSVYLLY